MKSPYKYRRSVLREELYALTCDSLGARILDQFLYWSERTKDYDQYVEEEMKRSQQDGTAFDVPLTNGWIYKKTSELKAEIMADESEVTIRRRIQELVELGWLEERTNPIHRWDKTLQYRPNIFRIMWDLADMGLTLADYHFPDFPKPSGESSNLHHEGSELRSEGAIPEITVKTTVKNISVANVTPQAEALSTPPSTEKKPRPKDELWDAIAEEWGMTDGSRVGRLKKQMLGNFPKGSSLSDCNFDTPVTVQEVRDFCKWYRGKYKGMTLPKDPPKLQDHFYTFRKTTATHIQNGTTPTTRVIQIEGKSIPQIKKAGQWVDAKQTVLEMNYGG